MRPLFLFKSEKKTDMGHLKQMREGLRNIFFCTVESRHIVKAHELSDFSFDKTNSQNGL